MLNGTAVIREEVALDPNANRFIGTFTVDVLDLTGKNLMHLAGAVRRKESPWINRLVTRAARSKAPNQTEPRPQGSGF